MDTHTEHLIGPVVVTIIGVSLARLLPRATYVVKTMVRIPAVFLNFCQESLPHVHTTFTPNFCSLLQLKQQILSIVVVLQQVDIIKYHNEWTTGLAVTSKGDFL